MLAMMGRNVKILSLALLLSACASGPAPPDWQANAFAALKGFSAAYLSGNTRLADFEFARAKTEIASTGRADLLARAELTRCAVRVASLEFDNCAGYQPLAPDAGAAQQAYAGFLSGRWSGLDPTLLPAQHRALVQQAAASKAGDGPSGKARENRTNPPEEHSVLNAIEDPLARLVAAGVLLQRSRLTPADIAVAAETASSQGWRRPLLAWLGLLRERAQATGDAAAREHIQRRINLVLQQPANTQAK